MVEMASGGKILIRKAQLEDCGELLSLFKEFANEHSTLNNVSFDADTLREDGFGEERLFHCFVAGNEHRNIIVHSEEAHSEKYYSEEDHSAGYHSEDNDDMENNSEKKHSEEDHSEETHSGKLVGFALYLFHYSEYEGVYVFLENLYVSTGYRDQGIETLLMRQVAKIALQRGCRRVDWICDRWQREKHFSFGEPEGVINDTTNRSIICFKLCGDVLKNIAHSKKVTEESIIIRKARPEDCEDIIPLIKGLAVHERNPARAFQADAGTLRRDGFESGKLFHCIVAEDQSAGGKLIGHTMYVFNYSPLDGVYIFLESFYVTSSYRNRGIGARLFQEVAKDAVKRGCNQMGWLAYWWNEDAVKFYALKGAINCTETMAAHYFRLSDEALRAFAAE